MASYYIFWHYFNIKWFFVKFHYDQVSNFTFPSVNFKLKKCPIHPEFLDTWFVCLLTFIYFFGIISITYHGIKVKEIEMEC